MWFFHITKQCKRFIFILTFRCIQCHCNVRNELQLLVSAKLYMWVKAFARVLLIRREGLLVGGDQRHKIQRPFGKYKLASTFLKNKD